MMYVRAIYFQEKGAGWVSVGEKPERDEGETRRTRERKRERVRECQS